MVLKSDAVIMNMFDKEEGFLYGENIFVGMENSLIKSILYKDNATKKEINEALYQIEYHYNLLGLELKNNSEGMSPEIIAEKILEAYKVTSEEAEYDVLANGETVAGIIPLNEEFETLEKDIQNDNVQLDLSSTIAALENSVKSVEEEASEEEKTTDFISNLESEVLASGKLTRDQKRKIAIKGIYEAFERGKERLSDIAEVVKETVDVSDTTVRNILLDMSADGLVEQPGRGKFKLTGSIETVEVGRNVVSDAEQVQPVEKPVTDNTGVVPVSEQVPVQTNVIQLTTVFPKFFEDHLSIESYLKELGVRTSLIKWVIEKRTRNAERLKKEDKAIVERIEKEFNYLGDVTVIEKALAAMMSDQPLSLKGEAGTGKTTLVETLSCLLNLPLFSINGSLESNKATLVGEKDIIGKGQLVTKDGQMTKAMKYGGLLYIDEINMMRPDVLALVNAATDHRKTFFNDVSKETIVGHKEYRFVSAMNVGYAGVKKMNEATMDRTASIVLTYMTKKEIMTMIEQFSEREKEKFDGENHPELAAIDVTKISKVYLELTAAVKSGSIPVLAASTRNIILLAKMVPIVGYELALQMVLQKFEKEDAATIAGVLGANELLDELGVEITALIPQDEQLN